MISSDHNSKFLERPVTDLPGISTKRKAALARLGIQTFEDLLYHLPRAYEDWTDVCPIANLEVGLRQTIKAEIVEIGSLRRKGRLQWWQLQVRDKSGQIQITYFNQAWLRTKFEPGQSLYFNGKVDARGFMRSMVNPAFKTESDWQAGNIVPIYPLTEGLSQNLIRKLISSLLDQVEQMGDIIDPLPKALRKRYKLANLSYALTKIHAPQNSEDLVLAKRRISFADLFLTGAALKLLRERRISQEQALPVILGEAEKTQFSTFIAGLPFKPTGSQVAACNDIFADLKREIPMSRLLQGDVGSGKTLVALLAMYYSYLGGQASILMAPTSILATQHYENFQNLLADTPVKLALLTGGLKAAERKQIKAQLEAGQIDMLIGTHAVISPDINLPNLGLVVTDEQHRFGVRQRSRALAQSDKCGGKEVRPHSLVMSATPIPRTLALIMYSDLDLSILRDKPAGRGKIETYTASSQDLGRIYKLIEREVKAGRQAYIVCPLLAESENSELEAAEQVYADLSRTVYRNYRMALLHGGMRADDKAQILLSFLNRELDIIVSTTVIEVGIDNPNASIMLIRDAERFGLAQLHQLRGRIGRGGHRSICILHSDTPNDGLARERLRTLCLEDDGFKIAEADLDLRGPGQFFGTRQHGLSEFQLAYSYADKDLLLEVDQALQTESLTDPGLLQAIEQRYPELKNADTL